MSEVIDIPEQIGETSGERMTSIPEKEFNRIMQEMEQLRQENTALKEVIVRMTAERYLPKENRNA